MNRTPAPLPTLRRTLLALVALGSSSALAAGTSVDAELLRPTFSPGTIPGVDSPDIVGAGAIRTGLIYQYERDPLILYRYGQEEGAVVANRHAASLGVSYDWSEWFSGRLVLPLAYQSGSEVADYDADGFGLSDLQAGVRAALPAGGLFRPGLHVDLLAPTGRQDAYLGEEGVRVSAGFLGGLDLDLVSVVADISFLGRKAVETESDFVLGSEVGINGAVLLHVWPERLTLGVGVLSRSGAENLWRGGAENSAELTSDVQFRFTRNLQLDVGARLGLADGYGTTEFRVVGGLTFIRWPLIPEPEPVPPPEEVKPPPRLEITSIEEADERPWQEGELARVDGLNIEIRDPILFEFGTNVIRDVSYPTLKSVSQILEAHGQIDAMVIEGHASEEGSYEYNYNLSTTRAQAVYQKLIEFGVHANRMAYRGMGEVVPVVQGDSEEALAANRRVEFHIVHLLDPLAPIPTYSASIKVPWSGEDIKAQQPGSAQIGSVAAGVNAEARVSEVQATQPEGDRVQQNFFDVEEEEGWGVPLPIPGKADNTDEAPVPGPMPSDDSKEKPE